MPLRISIVLLLLWIVTDINQLLHGQSSNGLSVSFSVPPGMYEAPIEVDLLYPEALTVWYTTDGSNPLTGQTPSPNAIPHIPGQPLYMDAHPVRQHRLSHIPTSPPEARSKGFGWFPPLDYGPQGHVIRAVGISADGRITDEVTGTWFIALPHLHLPAVSIIVDPCSFFDPDSGIYVPGRIYEQFGFGSMFWGEPHANYFQRGDEWERVAHLSYFVEGKPVLAQQVGIRIHGSGSRALPMKSLRLYARSRYGTSSFSYPFFGDDYDHSFNRLLLRNSGQDFYRRPTMIRDVVSASLFSTLHAPVQRFQPTVVFLNGEFWGVHNIRERFDRHYFERRFGIRNGELDLLEDDAVVSEGSSEHYRRFLEWVEETDLSGPGMLEAIQEWMDTDNYIDYLIAQLFVQNTDWPGRNALFWRNRGAAVPGVPETDGRWRWVIFDTDLAYVDAAENTLRRALQTGRTEWPNPDWSTFLFRRLLTNPEFTEAFLNRFTTLLYTDLRVDRVRAIIRERAEAIELAMPAHAARWQHPNETFRYPRATYTWSHQTERLHRFARNREGHLIRHLESEFRIRHTELETVVNIASAGNIHLNGRPLHTAEPDNLAPSGYNGRWIAGQRLTLTAEAKPGYVFAYWIVNDTEVHRGTTLTLQPDEATLVEAHFTEHTSTVERVRSGMWVFDENLPNNTPLFRIDPVDGSAAGMRLEFTPALEPVDGGSVLGMMDRVNDPTNVNLEDVSYADLLQAMRGIRVRNPVRVPSPGGDEESTVLLRIPTTGYYQPELSFAARRTPNGPEELRIELSVRGDASNDTDWMTVSGSWRLSESFSRYVVPLYLFEGSSDNTDLVVRIRFQGASTTGESGNVRFNNIIVTALQEPIDPVVATLDDRPEALLMLSNYPNPFNSSTTIRFELPSSGLVQADVYTTDGRHVARIMDQYAMAGTIRIPFSAGTLSSGLYLYRIRFRDDIITGRMTLIK